MNNSSINLPSSVSALRAALKVAIEHYQGSPVKNENKLNETTAVALGFQNYDQLAALLDGPGEVETYAIDFDYTGGQQMIINGIRIDNDLVHDGVLAYTVSDRLERISDIRMFIGEAQRDSKRSSGVLLMQADLDTLLASEEEYVLEAYGTSGFIAADLDPERFNKTCDEMIEAASEYYNKQIGELTKTGKLIADAFTYYGADAVSDLYENELVLIKEDRLADDKLPLGMPVYPYKGTVPEGYVAAYTGSFGEYVPITLFDE